MKTGDKLLNKVKSDTSPLHDPYEMDLDECIRIVNIIDEKYNVTLTVSEAYRIWEKYSKYYVAIFHIVNENYVQEAVLMYINE